MSEDRIVDGQSALPEILVEGIAAPERNLVVAVDRFTPGELSPCPGPSSSFEGISSELRVTALLRINQRGFREQVQRPVLSDAVVSQQLLEMLLGVIYSLRVKDALQHVSALVYAGAGIGAVFAGDWITLYGYTQ